MMIPEREREALMRLTMCARDECEFCKYRYMKFDNCKDLITKNMNILADALRKDKPQHGYMWVCSNCGLDVHSDYGKCPRCGALRDNPQADVRCEDCKFCKGVHVECDRCDKTTHSRFEPKTEPQTEREGE